MLKRITTIKLIPMTKPSKVKINAIDNICILYVYYVPMMVSI